MTKVFSVADAKAKFSEVISSAEHQEERVVIEKRRKPIAVIIGYNDYKLLEKLEDIYHSHLLKKVLMEDKFYPLDETLKKLEIEL